MPVNDPAQPKELPPTASAGNVGEIRCLIEESPLPPEATADGPGVKHSASPPADQLPPEEQMRLFAKELKEQDWGHQPC